RNVYSVVYRLLRGLRLGCWRWPLVFFGASSSSEGFSSSTTSPFRAALRARRSSSMRSASDPGVGELLMTHHCWPSDHTFEVVQYRSTPMGKDTPEMTNTPGSRYIRSFCWRAIGLSAAEAGMFFIVNCRCVNSIEALMSTTSTAVMIFTEMTSEPRKVEESEAPKISEFSIC